LPVAIAAATALTVDFQLPSGLVIRVPAHDRAALADVLELVEAGSCSV
jgi:hypothetical protein